ncbi:MAG: phosphoribosylamine--glycine ligase [Bacteroidetes bacterium 4572_112]|nr:MAG: phosphoribosylamine--glycine ligase [Bacteroidetes bacterium 4572_112]
MNVLLLGSGGREHTLAWKIAQSSKLNQLYIAPGNAGTSSHGTNVDLSLSDFDTMFTFVVDMSIDIIVVGPEQPLVDGIFDYFKSKKETKNVIIIGMNKEAAQLEGSKDYAKSFMMRHNVPTAAYKSFDATTVADGEAFLETLNAPYVLKADGLAAGKGVLILDSLEEAKSGLRDMLINNKFGAAGNQVVIEEFLSGIELSVFVLTDGEKYAVLPEAKDYKRIGEGDTGLNTGGMGSISPVPFADKAFMDKVISKVVEPTVKGIKADGLKYSGFVFIGLMKVGDEPLVIEYNVRMGDPETETVIPRLKNDLLELFVAMDKGELDKVEMEFDDRYAASVMLVSGGYPESYEKNKKISGLENISNTIAFHAGTTHDDNANVLSNGGRVIALTSYGKTMEEALAYSYKAADIVKFDKVYYRTDLGKDL